MITNRQPGDNRFFENRVLERLSMSHPILNTAVWLGIAALLIAWTVPAGGALAYLLTFPVTVLGWTFVEYWVHRKLFHYPFAPGRMAERAYILHEHHHDFPDEPFRNMMPLPISLAIGGLFYLAVGALFGWPVGAMALSQLGITFAAYDLTHYLMHRRWFRLLPGLKRHHMRHHFAAREFAAGGYNFGITTDLWDRVFGTKLPSAGKERAR